VREGLSWRETARAVDDSGAATGEEFRKAAFDPGLLAKNEIPSDSPEGYLFPETYLVSKVSGDNSRVLAEAMFKEFRKNARKVWPNGLPAPGRTAASGDPGLPGGKGIRRPERTGPRGRGLHEPPAPGDAPAIRPHGDLRLGQDYDGDLTRAHLEDGANPYNTYRISGLPPGPICSPGLISLQAAAAPEQHGFLYFVGKGDGTHFFSKSLEEHNQAVAKYQLRRNRATYRSTPAQN
jgi:Predicted periplasmic solute-binding protein